MKMCVTKIWNVGTNDRSSEGVAGELGKLG